METLRTKLAKLRAETTGESTVLVVGDTYVASAIARALAGTVEARLLTDDRGVARHAEAVPVWLTVDAEPGLDDGVANRSEVTVRPGSITDVAALRVSGAPDSDVAVVAVDSDARSLLVTQLLRTEFDAEDVVSVVEDPRSEETIGSVAPSTVCVADLVAATVTEALDERLTNHA